MKSHKEWERFLLVCHSLKMLGPKDLFKLHDLQILSPKQKVRKYGIGFHLVFSFSSSFPHSPRPQLPVKTGLKPWGQPQTACMAAPEADPQTWPLWVWTSVWWNSPALYIREKLTPWLLTLVLSSEQWCSRMTYGQMQKRKQKIFPSIQKKKTHNVYKMTVICYC